MPKNLRNSRRPESGPSFWLVAGPLGLLLVAALIGALVLQVQSNRQSGNVSSHSQQQPAEDLPLANTVPTQQGGTYISTGEGLPLVSSDQTPAQLTISAPSQFTLSYGNETVVCQVAARGLDYLSCTGLSDQGRVNRSSSLQLITRSGRYLGTITESGTIFLLNLQSGVTYEPF